MFNKRSKILFASAIAVTLYVGYLLISLGDMHSSMTDSFMGSLITVFFTAGIIPHLILAVLGMIFIWLGFYLRKLWLIIACVIVFCIGAIQMTLLAKFCIPIMILCLIGFVCQKKTME